MWLLNAQYDARCFLPIHVYDPATARPVALPLRPAPRRRVRNVATFAAPGALYPPALALARLTIRGDGHYAAPR
jgi:hypothetical protein